MSYAVSAALQEAVYQLLAADPAVTALVGDAIYDALPPGQLPPLYVSLGPETATDRSAIGSRGAEHLFTLSVVTTSQGFQIAKQVAAAINDALDSAAPALSRGRLVGMSFVSASAQRTGTGESRRIDIKFRALVEDD